MLYNTESCDTTRVHTREAFEDEMDTPGTFFLEEERGWIWVVLPHGHHAVLPVRGMLTENPLSSNAAWSLDGTEDAPTLSPSIHMHPNEDCDPPRPGWHGWLRDGRLVSC